MAIADQSVSSKLMTVNEVINSGFIYNIPQYQRLYVWEDAQVDKLLEDLDTASSNRNRYYYLGTVLTIQQKGQCYDLIDGQQRFTTLWLISFALGDSLRLFTRSGKALRLKFAIREEVTNYFRHLLHGQTAKEFRVTETNSSLLNIIRAQDRIRRFIQDKLKGNKSQIANLAWYIRYRVQFISTEVDPLTDLNKMFEVINNRGLQLEAQDILKASLLSFIPNEQERYRFSKLWNACANMNSYIERNLRIETGCYIPGVYNKSTMSVDIPELLKLMTGERARIMQETPLVDILENRLRDDAPEQEAGGDENDDIYPEEYEDEMQEAESILSFPQLLLHVLRIYLFLQGEKDIKRVDEKELLTTFKSYSGIEKETTAKKFIRLLLEVRFGFDNHIIKWVKTSDSEKSHLIKQLSRQRVKGRWYFRRAMPESNSGFALLQSMLYHSQQITTHYWLTPLLLQTLSLTDQNALFTYLIQLDNRLFCLPSTLALAERTRYYMDTPPGGHPGFDYTVLDSKIGVQFPHYWFYKVEFVLWYLLKDSKNEKWKNYRMTAKNSIEHISPRTPKREDAFPVSKELLDDFGNLVLVSRGINSEYGNNPFAVKRSVFLTKDKYDSLKSALIFEDATWGDSGCLRHHAYIKSLLVDYFKEDQMPG